MASFVWSLIWRRILGRFFVNMEANFGGGFTFGGGFWGQIAIWRQILEAALHVEGDF
jgi:hypothetical protein